MSETQTESDQLSALRVGVEKYYAENIETIKKLRRNNKDHRAEWGERRALGWVLSQIAIMLGKPQPDFDHDFDIPSVANSSNQDSLAPQ